MNKSFVVRIKIPGAKPSVLYTYASRVNNRYVINQWFIFALKAVGL